MNKQDTYLQEDDHKAFVGKIKELNQKNMMLKIENNKLKKLLHKIVNEANKELH